MLFPTTFISEPENTGVGLKKYKGLIFISVSPGEGLSNIPCFDLFLVQNEVISYLGYEIPI